MRYSMLVYIVKMCRTLSEAAEYISTAPEGELRAELLENGKQMLAQIRSVLEQHKPDLRNPELLDKLTALEAAWGGGSGDLSELLNGFAGELPESISCQVRAVFFAELGEKWDAMESVYEYMRGDPRFDPVVVRTPVGRVVIRNGKREQEIIYKDFLTPMGIPSLGCGEYSIEDDCPELAFISQPYESCTPEQFWPETIAKHTRLVYLPYYLPDKVAKATVTTLAQMPVYRFAWRVVCSTEKHYRFYSRHAANGGANAMLTGIPKTDPLVRLAQQPAQRPAEWSCLEGKTVFLWNTWYDINVSSLRYFEKITQWFQAHENCGLIWRKHPMTDTVVKLHYPDKYPAYREMIKRADEAENMVVDTETSCAAAFSVSDAMISDYSSLLPQYLILDKPALWITGADFSFTGEEFISGKWMEQADNAAEVIAFIERICAGEDRKSRLRRDIRETELALSDGRCGERICDALWDALMEEEI